MCSVQTNRQGGLGAAPLSAVNQGGDPAGSVWAWGSVWCVQGLDIVSKRGFCHGEAEGPGRGVRVEADEAPHGENCRPTLAAGPACGSRKAGWGWLVFNSQDWSWIGSSRRCGVTTRESWRVPTVPLGLQFPFQGLMSPRRLHPVVALGKKKTSNPSPPCCGAAGKSGGSGSDSPPCWPCLPCSWSPVCSQVFSSSTDTTSWSSQGLLWGGMSLRLA